MKKLTIVWLLLFSLAAVGLQAAEIDPSLQAALSDLPASGMAPALVYLEQQADIASLNDQLKAERATLAERNRRVVLALQEVATQSQPEMVAFLEQLKAQDLIGEYRTFWIANVIKLEATPAGIEALAARLDVQAVYLDYEIEGIKPVSVTPDNNILTGHEIGLERINAHLAWAQGWTGAGRVVMNIDTGVAGTHAALQNRFRGDVDSDGDVDESWFDPYTTQYPTPIDDGGHGTHTMGTICGRTDSGDTIGVAIDAQWIAAAAIDRGGGIPRTVADALASFQWAVDPDGNPNTQDNPDAIGNSWGVTTSHGYPPCDQTFWMVIDNCEAAGSVVIFSAGNEGSSGLRRPADRGTTPTNCFAVGAVDGRNANLPIASFSSLGPSTCGPNGETVIKPEVVAPGVQIRSSVPSGGYESWDGTSMASPHITGSVAVMRQINPNLDAETIKQILINTSHDLPFTNPNGEDNTFGNGVIDLYAACQAAMSGYGFIDGFVRDSGNQPIDGAQVRVMGAFARDYADPTGYYYMGVQADTTYTLEASYFGYIPATAQAAVVADETTSVNFVLQTAPSGTLQGTVIDLADSTPIEGANVEIAGTPITPVNTNSAGFYQFPAIPGGSTYTVRVRASGYGIGQDTVFIPAGGGATRNFALGAFESFENDNGGWTGSGTWEWGEPTSGPGSAFDGTKVWATVLAGTYPDDADDPLITGYYTIDDAFASISFYHWHEFESGYDGGNLSVSTDGGLSWEIVTPDGDYPDQNIVGLDNEPGFTGNITSWEQKVFNLGAYQGAAVKFRFRFGSDGSVVRSGWYLDAVVVSGGTAWNSGTPDINVTPMAFNVGVEAGDTLAMPITISNTGDGLLVFGLSAVTTVLAAENEPRQNDNPARLDENWGKYVTYQHDGDRLTVNYGGPKPAENSEPSNPPMTLNSGGPDAYGYMWFDSNEPGGPIFNWVDISTIGTPVTLGDDVNVGPFDLGFNFEYYGEVFTSLNIASNGFVSFTSTSGSLSNSPIPTAAEPNNLLSIFWDDLAPHNGGQIFYYADAANSRFIVSYDGVPHYSNYGALYFQVIINESGNILYQYGSMADGGHGNNGATVGIENGTGTDGLQVIHNQDGITDNMAIEFRKPIFWLRAVPRSGLCFPTQTFNGMVVFDATTIGAGEYAGYLRVSSNDPDEASIVIPCTLNVGPVGIADGSGEMPGAFNLSQNYPNPFNPATQISFVLPTASEVSLAVYDILGKQVKTLVSGKLEAGSHSITWDGTDQAGGKVSSGIYFYNIKAGDFSQSRKMVLMK